MKPEIDKAIKAPPGIKEENDLISRGYNYIAGIDEAGRGALAGPVVAAAVILPPSDDQLSVLSEVRDSKEVLPKKREFLYDVIRSVSLSTGVGIVLENTIDRINILQATMLAMQMAEKLTCWPDYLLIDGMIIPNIKIRQKKIVNGDKLCLSIACASIIAKVTRDRIMVEMNNSYPDYGFDRHKGYGTKYHISCLNIHGPSPIHRRSFMPVKIRLY